jgi:3-phosphoshikimate 1-carboxyvinyltransferase
MTPAEFMDVLRRPLAELPRELEMVPLPGPFDVAIRPPGSKSLTNRALLLAALAEGESVLSGALLDADDAVVMIEALRRLGAEIMVGEESHARARGSACSEPLAGARGSSGTSIRVRGTSGRLKGGCTLNLKNAGTATRFLTAAACLADGPVVIDGNERMRQRPIGELVAMLRRLGVRVDEVGAPGCVPVRVWPARPAGGVVRVSTSLSSQFTSALLMIAPFFERGVRVEFVGAVTSPAYIDMTLGLMNATRYAACRGMPSDGWIEVDAGRPRAIAYDVEPDASGATYWWGAEAIVPGSRVAVPIDPARSLQADAAFRGALASVGSRVDLSLMPDAAMTLAAVACFAQGTTTITGLRTLRVKETDRLEAMRTELSKIGARVDITRTGPGGPGDSSEAALIPGVVDEGMQIAPPPGGVDCSPSTSRVVLETYDDHRMAMSLALIGLRRARVVIRDPACVAKTYPAFWLHLSLLYESAAAGGVSV